MWGKYTIHQRLLGCDPVAVSLQTGCAFRMVWTGSAGKEFTGQTRWCWGGYLGINGMRINDFNLFWGSLQIITLHWETSANQVVLHDGLFSRLPHALLDFTTINHHWTVVCFVWRFTQLLKSRTWTNHAFFYSWNPLGQPGGPAGYTSGGLATTQLCCACHGQRWASRISWGW